MTKPHPNHCGRCGSARIGRARSRTSWHRLMRDFTPFERYACGACGHRGWRIRALHLGQDEAQLVLGMRGVEGRDRRAARHARRRLVRGLLLAVILGCLTAVYLLRSL